MQSIFWRINEMFDERTCDFQLEMDKEKFETSKINIIKILYILYIYNYIIQLYKRL